MGLSGALGPQPSPKWSPKNPKRPPEEDPKSEITATWIRAASVDRRPRSRVHLKRDCAREPKVARKIVAYTFERVSYEGVLST